MKKLLVSLLSLMMVIALAMPVSADDGSTGSVTGCQAVETEEQLRTCLQGEEQSVVITKQINVTSDLDGVNKTVTVRILDNAPPYARSALYFTQGAQVSNITIVSENNNMKYGIHIQSNGGELKLNNVSIQDYIYAGVNISGAKLSGDLSASTKMGGYAAVELSMGSGITTIPTIDADIQLDSDQPVYADIKQISEKVSDDEDKITIEVLVSSDDMGRVIGKKGMIASAIRTIVQASSYLNHEKRAVINIDSF